MPAPSPIRPARKPSPPPALPAVCAIASNGLASTIAAAIPSHLPNRRNITCPPWFARGHQPGPWALFSPLYPLPPREPDHAWSRNYTFLAYLLENPGGLAPSRSQECE